MDREGARYVLDVMLGEGAMGVVWRAWRFLDPSKQRYGAPPELVALKFIRSEIFADTGTNPYRAFFRNEVEALRRLDHPNVVGFVEVFDYEQSSVLALEFVEGETLEQVLQRHKARRTPQTLPGLPFQRAYYYFEQLLGALAASHALGIVHRDIKPSNVLVRKDGIVKLTDYGIAAVKRKTLYVQTGGARQDLVPGTGAYMSPEQVIGAEADGRSDVYSASILLYELLTGQTPYETDGRSEWMVRMNHIESAPRPITNLIPQAPPVLNDLFAAGLAKDPNHRFQSAVAMGQAFRSALGIPDSPEWRAQVEFAELAAKYRGNTVGLQSLSSAKQRTLQEAIVHRYRTRPITRP